MSSDNKPLMMTEEQLLKISNDYKNALKDLVNRSPKKDWTGIIANLVGAIILGAFGAYIAVKLSINDLQHNVQENTIKVEMKLSKREYLNHIVMDNYNFQILEKKCGVELIEHDVSAIKLVTK